RLHNSGIIRIMDVLIIEKREDGSIEGHELSDFDDLGELGQVEEQLAETLAEDDVLTLADVMAPGSIAGVLIFENLWAAPFASAMSRAGGHLIATGRTPIQAIAAAIEADEAISAGGN